MTRAYIYVGGPIDAAGITERPRDGELTVAADSGWDNAALLGITPSLLVGDFDSIRQNTLPEDTEILRVPAEKDRTDTQLAVELAISRGARELVIVGGLTGRLDHTLSNLGVLEKLHAAGVHAVMTDGQNRVRFIRNGSALIAKGAYTYLSLLVADDRAKGVEIKGCKYELAGATLTRHDQYAVSNEITGNCALVSVRRGGLFIIESKDTREGKGEEYGKHQSK